jgi:hypothetical protein
VFRLAGSFSVRPCSRHARRPSQFTRRCLHLAVETVALNSIISHVRSVFRRVLNICEKRLLASSRPSVRMEQPGSRWTDFN